MDESLHENSSVAGCRVGGHLGDADLIVRQRSLPAHRQFK